MKMFSLHSWCFTTALAFISIAIGSSGLQAADAPAKAAQPEVAKEAPKENKWEKNILKFEEEDKKQATPRNTVVFVGSSTIVKWNIPKSFPNMPIVKRGFGGSQMIDSAYYAERIVTPYKPKLVICYAGDNDLAAKRTPEQVLASFDEFVKKVRTALPETKIVYLGIKPSVARWKNIENIRKANKLIVASAAKDPLITFIDLEKPCLGEDGTPRADLLEKDGLHFNAAGYAMLDALVMPHVKAALETPAKK